MTATEIGQIIRSHGRSFIVEVNGREYNCSTRGKRVDFACGDIVDILVQNQKQAVIESVHERQSLLYRRDEWRTKIIAANVTRILFVIAAVPTPSEEFLNRCLIAAEAANIDPVIVVNKSDLPQTAALLSSLETFQQMGYQLVTLSAKQDVSLLLPWLSGQTCVMLYALMARDKQGSLEQRMAARPAHLARLTELQNQGRLIIAGPFPAIDSIDPGPAGYSGSLVVAEFDSLEAAQSWADADPYVKAGVYADIEIKPCTATSAKIRLKLNLCTEVTVSDNEDPSQCAKGPS